MIDVVFLVYWPGEEKPAMTFATEEAMRKYVERWNERWLERRGALRVVKQTVGGHE